MIACRACSLQTKEFTSVYSKRNDTTLAQMLQTLVPVQIPEPNDGILTVMCADCVEHTVNAYNFVQVVLDADIRWNAEQSQRDENDTPTETPSEPGTPKSEAKRNVEDKSENEDDAYDEVEFLLEVDDDEASERMSTNQGEDETASEQDEVHHPTPSANLKHVKYFPKLASGDSTFRCCGRKCLLTFSSREALEQHGATEHGVRQRELPWGDSFQYECTVCFARFEYRKNLLTHLRRLVRDFQCPVCWVCFERPLEKSAHMKAQHADHLRRMERKSYRLEAQPMKICCGCGEQFGTVEELLAHGQSEHVPAAELKQANDSGEQPNEVCNVCGKAFKNAASLRYHQLSVYRAKPFRCGQCGETFAFSSRLEAHQQVHAAECRFVCETCGAAYKTKVGLVGHVATHREKTFQCTECDYRTVKASRLKVHMRLHTGEMPFACQQCPKRCRSKSNLASHMRSHAGDKSFPCRYCERRYVYVSDRTKHERVHTGEIPYGCAACGKKFSRPCMLEAHGKVCKKAKASTKASVEGIGGG